MTQEQDIVYGIHAVRAALERESLVRLWLAQGRTDGKTRALSSDAARLGVVLEHVSGAALDELTRGAVHQGVAGQLRSRRSRQSLSALLDNLTETPFLLVLDGVQDPHNLGACMRSAAAAGVHAVVAPKDRAVSLTPAARKVASGAADVTPFIRVTNLARTLRMIKERAIWTVGLAGEAQQSLYELDLGGPMALVLGAEGSGLRRLTKKHCDFLARIPMAQGVESLNVSVSTGVALFEAVRQRRR